jgi:hypothetical protein
MRLGAERTTQACGILQLHRFFPFFFRARMLTSKSSSRNSQKLRAGRS